MGTCELCCAFCSCLLFFGLLVTYVVYLGIFAFANPDKQAYYMVDAYNEKMTETAENESAVNVHGQFVAWFIWGFIMALSPCAVGLILVLSSYISDSLT